MILFRTRLVLTASGLTLAALGALPALAAEAPAAPATAAPAAAETSAAPDASGDQLSEIVVTAEKRPQSLQTTPIAISVLDSNTLTNRHVVSLLDIGDGAVPSLRVAPFYSRNSALVLNVRGVGVLSDSNQPARDQGVGVYIDGVYLGRAQGLGTALFDIESIEVLKGPQGTLFGRNTEGGAVSIVTRKPSGEFHLNTTVGYGNYGAYKGEIHLDLPSWHNIAVKIDGVVSHRDGTVKNPLAGQTDFNAYDKRGLHAEALWKPVSNFSADYSFDMSYDSSTPYYLQGLTHGTVAQAPALYLQPTRADVANIGAVQQASVGKTFGHRLTLDWDIAPSIKLKSISSYRTLSQGQYDNGSVNGSAYTAGGSFARYSLAHFWQHQGSQEFQLIGETGEFKYVAGAMYYIETVQDDAQAFYTMQWNSTGTAGTVISPLTAKVNGVSGTYDYSNYPAARASHVTSQSLGVFGQATWTPAFLGNIAHLTGGLRWSRDIKHGDLFLLNGATPVSATTGQTSPYYMYSSWSRVDPMVNIAVDVTRDVHLYGKWSTGYRSGGANSRSLSYAPFNPESVSMFEAGIKSEFFNRRARLNIAAYTGSYKNPQIDFSAVYLTYDANGNLINNTTRTTTDTANAPGSGRLTGIEAELTVNPLRGLNLTASYAHTHVRMPDTLDPFPYDGVNYYTSPTRIYPTYTPQNAVTGAIDYERPIGNVTLRAHLDGNYDDGQYVASYFAPGTEVKSGRALVFNGRLSLADVPLNQSGAKMAFSFWVRNLFNEQHVWYAQKSIQLGTQGFFNDPRTFGGELNVRF